MQARTLIFSIFFLCLSSASADDHPARITSAEIGNKCALDLEHCFSKTDVARSDCFLEMTEKNSCKNTVLGNLAYKRWVYSAAQIPGRGAPPALMGPGLVDGECVSNFDNQWLSDLVREDYSQETIKILDRKLESCRKNSSQELFRP